MPLEGALLDRRAAEARIDRARGDGDDLMLTRRLPGDVMTHRWQEATE